MKYANHTMDEIPIGSENAITNAELRDRWGVAERTRQDILRELRLSDNGDGYILITTPDKGAHYRTNDPAEIRGFLDNCQQQIDAIQATAKKARRIMQKADAPTINPAAISKETLVCNLKDLRLLDNVTQSDFVRFMRERCPEFDRMTLSKAENGHILLTPAALAAAAEILGCNPDNIYPNLLTCLTGTTEDE